MLLQNLLPECCSSRRQHVAAGTRGSNKRNELEVKQVPHTPQSASFFCFVRRDGGGGQVSQREGEVQVLVVAQF